MTTKKIMTWFASLLGILLLANLQVRTQSVVPEDTLSICDLLRKPSQSDGTTLRIRALYRFGPEWSEAYCLACWNRDHSRIWVDFDSSFKKKSAKRLRKLFDSREISGTLSVVFLARFSSKPSVLGHANEYDFAMTVEKVEEAKLVSRESPIPPLLKRDVNSECNLRVQ